MFDSLKSKLKGIGKSASKLDSEKIYEDPEEEAIEENVLEEKDLDEDDLDEVPDEEEIDAEDLDDDAFFEKLENDYFEERAKESGSAYAPKKTAPPKPIKPETPKTKKEERVEDSPKVDDSAEKKRAAAEEKEKLAAQKKAEAEAAAEERRLAKAAEKERSIAEKKAKEDAEAERKRLAESAEKDRLAAKKKAKEDADAAEKERSAAKKRADEEAAAEKKELAAEMAALEAERNRLAEEKKRADAEAKAAAAVKIEKVPEPNVPEKTGGKPLSRKEWLKRNKQKPQDKKESAEENTIDQKDRSAGGMFGDSGKRIKEDPLDDLLDELEVILLESDVAYPVVQDIILGVRDNLLNKKYKRQYSLEEIVEMAVKESVRGVLKINEFDFDRWFEEQPKPVVIMFVGINGTGKTTAIAKIAKRLLTHEKSVVVAACDTFRAGAIEQLSIHAERLNVKIVKHQQDADPSAVAFDAIEHARSKKKDAVLLDTAGRMQTNNNLIDEMKKIARVSKPALKIFVGDALAGNDAIEQAKVFDKAIGVDAIILTKIDTDAKGGAALSIAHTIGKPIAFVSNGQEYDDLLVFDSNWMLDRLFEE